MIQYLTNKIYRLQTVTNYLDLIEFNPILFKKIDEFK